VLLENSHTLLAVVVGAAFGEHMLIDTDGETLGPGTVDCTQ